MFDPASDEEPCIMPLSQARLWAELFMTFITAGNILSQFKLKINKKVIHMQRQQVVYSARESTLKSKQKVMLQWI